MSDSELKQIISAFVIVCGVLAAVIMATGVSNETVGGKRLGVRNLIPAVRIGAGYETVRQSRKRSGNANALTDVRLGRDGKRYKLPTPEFTAADADEVGAPANGPRSTARDNAC